MEQFEINGTDHRNLDSTCGKIHILHQTDVLRIVPPCNTPLWDPYKFILFLNILTLLSAHHYGPLGEGILSNIQSALLLHLCEVVSSTLFYMSHFLEKILR